MPACLSLSSAADCLCLHQEGAGLHQLTPAPPPAKVSAFCCCLPAAPGLALTLPSEAGVGLSVPGGACLTYRLQEIGGTACPVLLAARHLVPRLTDVV